MVEKSKRELDDAFVIEYRYGWGKFTPDLLQRFNKPPYLLLCLSSLLIVQGFIANGATPASASHLERRFYFTSTSIGAINSMYDVGALVMLIPISVYGSRGHKGRWLGIGALLIGLASILFTLPHFVAAKYDPGEPKPDQNCSRTEEISTISSTTELPDCHPRVVENKSTFLLYVARFLYGVGGSPLWTIAIAYLDENVAQRVSSTYVGIYSTNLIVGPSLGFVAAAAVSRIYGDFDKVDPAKVPFTIEDPRWYGAWWIVVLGGGLVSFALAVPIFGFGRQLPGSLELREADVDEAYHGSISLHASVAAADWSEFLRYLKVICRKPTYIGLIVHDCSILFIASGLAIFSTKYLETQFSMTTARASLSTAAGAVPPALIGTVIGTFLQRRLRLKCAGNMILAILTTGVSIIGCSMFFAMCPTRAFAGGTMFRLEESTDVTPDDSCNEECHCSLAVFDSVCWQREEVSLYSGCYASNCSWLHNDTLVEGLCPSTCGAKDYVPFLIGFAVVTLLLYVKKNPIQQAILRCVPFEMRTFALGLGWIPMRLFGMIPAGPVVGHIFNSSCMMWQEHCGTKEMCVLYDNDSLASRLQLASVVCFGLAYVALVVAWKFYVPPKVAESTTRPRSNRSIIEEALCSSWREPVIEM